jgi:glycosyltransferase involved in cell wall biosynthesis
MLAGLLPPPPGGVETITKLLWESSLRASYRMVLFEIKRTRGKEFQGRFDFRNTRDAAYQVLSCFGALVKERPQVVHYPLCSTMTGFLRDCALIWMSRAMGSYVIVHCHGSNADTLYLDGGPWRRRMIRALLRAPSQFIVLSAYWQRHFSRLAPRTPIVTIPIAVSPQYLEPFEREVHDLSGQFRVLFVGVIGERKGAHDLIEAAAIMNKQIARLSIRIVGTEGAPGTVKAYQDRIQALGLEGVVCLVGPRIGEDLLAEYRSADVFALPTYAENQPSVLIEAMATGACVVSTNLPAIEDVVSNRVNGLLVRPGDQGALADAIISLHRDPLLCKSLRINGIETVRSRFLPERLVRDVSQLYTQALVRWS